MSNQIKFFQTSERNSINQLIETIDSLRVFLKSLKLSKFNLPALFCLLGCLTFHVVIRAQDKTIPVGDSTAVKKIDLLQPLRICEIYKDNNLKALASDNANRRYFDEQYSIYLLSGKSNVIAFDVKSNRLVWSSELGGVIVSQLVIDSGKIYVITAPEITKKEEYPTIKNSSDEYTGYSIWTLDENTGITINRKNINLNLFTPLIVNSLENFLLVSDTTKNLIKIAGDAADKNNVETPYTVFKLPARLNSPPALSKSRIYAAIETNSILILSAGKSDFFSTLHTIPFSATILELFNNFLLFGDKNGLITLYDSTRDKIVWRRRYGGEVSSITFTDDSVLITSLDNFAYRIKLSKGKTLWKKRLSGRVSIKPLITENFLSVIIDADNNVYVIDLKDGKVVNQISLPENIVVLQSPIDFGKYLIFPTNKGLYKVVDQDEKCPPS